MSISQSDQARIFPKLEGINYIEGLKKLHSILEPEWYLEVGSAKGNSLSVSRANSIVVDPILRVEPTALVGKNEIHIFQMTSDDFFKTGRASEIAGKIDFSFLDGLHLFEFLLRDFINTELLCHKDSTVAMHDCIPITAAASEREWDRKITKAWTGDVWKLIPVFKKYRPDLKISILDCPPSGLTVVKNLDPGNSVLKENYDKIIAEYIGQTIESFGKDKLLDLLSIKMSRAPETFINVVERTN